MQYNPYKNINYSQIRKQLEEKMHLWVGAVDIGREGNFQVSEWNQVRTGQRNPLELTFHEYKLKRVYVFTL